MKRQPRRWRKCPRATRGGGALYHLISDAFYVIPDDLLLNVLFCKVMAERQFYPEASERFIQVQNILERDGMTSPLISLLYIECANRLVEGRRMAGAFDGRPTPDIPINTEIMIEAVKICPRQPGIPIYLKMPELN
ncbi:MAG: hypothetical protein WBK55_06960 [Alphaproteobacteria bacterium]